MPGPLGLLDLAALAVFLSCWFGCAMLVDRVPRIRPKSVIAAMDEDRRRWMRGLVGRDNRVFDAMAIGHRMSSGTFLATSSISILGGLVALLGASDMGRHVVSALPFAAPTSRAPWESRSACCC
jgi:uncharacterized membrane protein